jgi:peptide/nickel transport system substrate-binding protein
VHPGQRPVALLILLVMVSCAPAAAPRAGDGPANDSSTQPTRTLVTTIRVEPETLASRLGQAGGATLTFTRRVFNAYLTLFDDKGQAQPYLAAALPQLNTTSWRVSPDGRMETLYTLKPNITWHDGAPLTADDFVFAHRVYSSPVLGFGGVPPANLIDDIVASDPLTFTIHWRASHPRAGMLTQEFPPMPRHVLDAAFQSQDPDQFGAHAFWSNQFVGAGPFQLERWEAGAFIDSRAFDRHVLGAPKIPRMRLVFINDSNTALANMLAGDVHLAPEDSAIRFAQVVTLQREWAARNGGSILIKPDLWRSVFIQFHPERVANPALGDIRVRRALAHSIDKQGLDEALFEGQGTGLGVMADVPFIPRTAGYFSQIDPVATRYPYDPGRAQALLREAGYAPAGDGVFASPNGRLAFDLLTGATAQNESEMAVIAAGWRQTGFDIRESVMPAALAQDGMARTVFPGLSIISIPLGEDTLAAAGTAGMSTAENRWTGRNRGNWSNAEFDRFADMFTSTLDQQQRVQAIAGMVRVLTQELPYISMYFQPTPTAFVSGLRGPREVDPAADIAWNIHEWEFR